MKRTQKCVEYITKSKLLKDQVSMIWDPKHLDFNQSPKNGRISKDYFDCILNFESNDIFCIH